MLIHTAYIVVHLYPIAKVSCKVTSAFISPLAKSDTQQCTKPVQQPDSRQTFNSLTEASISTYVYNLHSTIYPLLLGTYWCNALSRFMRPGVA